MSEKRTFELKNGSSRVFLAYEYALRSDSTSYLTSLEGWDDFDGINIETEPKLSSPGSFVISSRIAERNISVSINVKNSEANPTALPDSIRALMLPMTKITMIRSYGSSKTETLEGFIKGIRVNRSLEFTSIDLTIICPEPLKTTKINTSTTQTL